jgi:para-aminobenzoate synthetase / 4-amino-4-deoxychorismate lyase
VHASSRPDPQKGIFETLLVVDDRPVELDAHLERLAASVAALYGPAATVDPRAEIVERSAGLPLGRLRVTLTPSGDDRLAVEIRTAEVDPALVFPGRERAVAGHTVLLAGGLGPHKWVDRELIDETEARLPGDVVPLIVDHGGAVLEASRANVFAVRDGVLETPPADGRILPGIARRRIAEAAPAIGLATRENELTVGNLIAADEVFFAGSVRGVEPVRAIDGVELAHPHAVGTRLGAQLKAAWMPATATTRSG